MLGPVLGRRQQRRRPARRRRSGSPPRGAVPAMGWARTLSPTRDTSSSGAGAHERRRRRSVKQPGNARRSRRSSRPGGKVGVGARRATSRASTTLSNVAVGDPLGGVGRRRPSTRRASCTASTSKRRARHAVAIGCRRARRGDRPARRGRRCRPWSSSGCRRRPGPRRCAGTTNAAGASGSKGRAAKATGPVPGRPTSSSTSMAAERVGDRRQRGRGRGTGPRCAVPRPARRGRRRPCSNSTPSAPATSSRSTSASTRRVRARVVTGSRPGRRCTSWLMPPVSRRALDVGEAGVADHAASSSSGSGR